MKNILKILTIIVCSFMALLLTRMGLSYLLILILIGLILPIITKDKRSAVSVGIFYATLSYILSYPSGAFLINFMPNIEIPINVSPFEVFINLLLGLLIPVIIAIIITFITAVIGKYLSSLIGSKKEETHNAIHFESKENSEIYSDDLKEYSRENYAERRENKQEKFSSSREELYHLSPIQRAKNRRKQDKEF